MLASFLACLNSRTYIIYVLEDLLSRCHSDQATFLPGYIKVKKTATGCHYCAEKQNIFLTYAISANISDYLAYLSKHHHFLYYMQQCLTCFTASSGFLMETASRTSTNNRTCWNEWLCTFFSLNLSLETISDFHIMSHWHNQQLPSDNCRLSITDPISASH